MSFVGLEATSTALASLPMVCPHCGRETIHIYGQEGKAPRLLSWTFSIGPRHAFVRCTMCDLSRRVPSRDRKMIQRAIRYNPRAAFYGQVGGYVETTLGRIDSNPSRIRRYPTPVDPKLVAVGLVLLMLIASPAVMYHAVQLVAEAQGDRWADKGQESYEEQGFQAALFWYARAQQMFRIARSPIKEARCVYMIGCIHYEQDEYWDALVAYEETLPVWEEINDREMQADCLMYIGYLRLYLFDLEGALEALERSRLLWVEEDEWRLQAEAFRGLGLAYEGLGQYGQAIEAYSQALALFEKLNDREEAFGMRYWIDQLRRLRPYYTPGEQHTRRLLNAV